MTCNFQTLNHGSFTQKKISLGVTHTHTICLAMLQSENSFHFQGKTTYWFYRRRKTALTFWTSEPQAKWRRRTRKIKSYRVIYSKSGPLFLFLSTLRQGLTLPGPILHFIDINFTTNSILFLNASEENLYFPFYLSEIHIKLVDAFFGLLKRNAISREYFSCAVMMWH